MKQITDEQAAIFEALLIQNRDSAKLQKVTGCSYLESINHLNELRRPAATPSPLPETVQGVQLGGTLNIEGKPYNVSFDGTQIFYNLSWQNIIEREDGSKYINWQKKGKIQYIIEIDHPATPSANELESSEMQRAIGDETGGNEREKANKFTDAEKERFRYEEYCQCKMEIDEIPLTIDQWREIDEYGNRGNEQGGFTPGEWEAKYNTELFPGQAAIYGCDGDENGRVIAVMDTSDETDTANIDLVCKAPKLYYALKEVSNYFEEQTPEVNEEGSSAYEFYRKIKSILNSINKQ